MGLQPASSCFLNYCMATVVLAGLMYKICESYIDDIIVHAQHEDNLLTNLWDVFKRFRRYKINLNPKKSLIGLLKIEYVGHQINAEPRECILQKRSWVKKLLLFVTPQGAKRLRSWRNTFLHMYRNNTLCSFSNKEYKNISKVHNSNTPNLVRWSSDVLSLVQCFMMVEANEVTGASPAELYSAIWYSWIIGVFSCHNLQNLSMLK